MPEQKVVQLAGRKLHGNVTNALLQYATNPMTCLGIAVALQHAGKDHQPALEKAIQLIPQVRLYSGVYLDWLMASRNIIGSETFREEVAKRLIDGMQDNDISDLLIHFKKDKFVASILATHLAKKIGTVEEAVAHLNGSQHSAISCAMLERVAKLLSK